MRIHDIVTSLIGDPSTSSLSNPKWRCPFHEEETPSFSIDGKKDRYKCFGCGVGGDAVDFLRRFYPGLSFAKAKQIVGGREPLPNRSGFVLGSSSKFRRRSVPKSQESILGDSRGVLDEGLVEAPLVDFDELIRPLVEKSKDHLWSDSDSSRKILAYLEKRGIDQSSVKDYSIGACPIDDDPKLSSIPRIAGIWIPWFSGGKIVATNVRRAANRKPKYMLIRGSVRSSTFPEIQPFDGRPLLVVEGEFDAILLRHRIGAKIQVVTLGSASSRPPANLLLTLAGFPLVFAGFDADQAGESAWDSFRSALPTAIRVRPDQSKDWSEMFAKGINLYGWFEKLLEIHKDSKPNPDWRIEPDVNRVGKSTWVRDGFAQIHEFPVKFRSDEILSKMVVVDQVLSR